MSYEKNEKNKIIDEFFDDFIDSCKRTESHLEVLEVNKEILSNLIKIYIEISEILDGVKKATFYNKETKYITELYQRLAHIKKLAEISSSPIFDERNKRTKGDKIESLSPRLFHGILGKMTECGELAKAIINVIDDPTVKIDSVNIQEELGDDDWYNSIIHDALGLKMRHTKEKVISKLKVRYSDGYSDKSADTRNLDAEREELEKNI